MLLTNKQNKKGQKMPKALYKQQIKELQTLKKDGKKAALMGEKIIDSKIKRLKTKLKGYKTNKKFRR